MDIHLYCNCYKNNINRLTEYTQTNLMLGSVTYSPELKTSLSRQNFTFDDTGDNISHLNHWFGQLTGLYWTWKNQYNEIMGTSTYRIFWGDYFLNNKFEKNTLYVPEYLDMDVEHNGNWINCSIYEQYSYCHGSTCLDLLHNLSLKSMIDLKPYMMENLHHQQFLHPYNMFISEQKIFDKICSIFFDIIFNFYDLHKDKFPEIKNSFGQNRILDFLGERIFHIIYTNSEYYFGKLNIKSIPVTVLPK